jgi:hypothetical protein
VLAGSSASIIDTSGNAWTITSGGLVAINGTADTTTANVTELAYVNGTIWQENASNLWWGETQPNAAWAPAMGTSVSPLPASPTPTPAPTPAPTPMPTPAPTPMPTPTPTAPPSANDTVVLAGSSVSIIDASGNAWTITSGGLVAVNGTADTTTANVTELAYVNGAVWQENASNLWWAKTNPTAAWAPGMGTSTSPLPPPISIATNQTSTTVSQSQVSVVATAGAHMLFISGSADVVSLSGAVNRITDTGSQNTYVLPLAGHGSDTFTSNILNLNDTLDLKPALAATAWNNTLAALPNYLTIADSAKGAVVSISATPGGSHVAIATIDGATKLTLSSLLAHVIT